MILNYAPKELEARTGKKVVSKLNAKTALPPKQIEPIAKKLEKN